MTRLQLLIIKNREKRIIKELFPEKTFSNDIEFFYGESSYKIKRDLWAEGRSSILFRSFYSPLFNIFNCSLKDTYTHIFDIYISILKNNTYFIGRKVFVSLYHDGEYWAFTISFNDLLHFILHMDINYKEIVVVDSENYKIGLCLFIDEYYIDICTPNMDLNL